jgi:hypothetical protein
MEEKEGMEDKKREENKGSIYVMCVSFFLLFGSYNSA